MPIYEYQCSRCGTQFESIRTVSRADDPIECKLCGAPASRQISNFSFKSDTFTSPKLRNRPGATFRGDGTESAAGSDAPDAGVSAG